nr:sulfated surface glycoprotein 185-like [Aegilops tauschii subsp. strangulata]
MDWISLEQDPLPSRHLPSRPPAWAAGRPPGPVGRPSPSPPPPPSPPPKGAARRSLPSPAAAGTRALSLGWGWREPALPGRSVAAGRTPRRVVAAPRRLRSPAANGLAIWCVAVARDGGGVTRSVRGGAAGSMPKRGP